MKIIDVDTIGAYVVFWYDYDEEGDLYLVDEIWRDYGRFVFAREKKNVEKELKRLGIIDGAGEEKPSKKGLFGLFRK